MSVEIVRQASIRIRRNGSATVRCKGTVSCCYLHRGSHHIAKSLVLALRKDGIAHVEVVAGAIVVVYNKSRRKRYGV